MGARRLGFALVAALVISVTITSIFYINITRRQASVKPVYKRVVGAATALQPGTPLTEQNLTEINWPVNVNLDGLIEDKKDAVGAVLIYGVQPNEPVLKHDLAPSGSYGLSAKIPTGMRASSVKTNEVMDVAGFLFPGSHVDVLVTLRPPDNNPGNILTRTVLQNVQVLATGTRTDPDPNGKPETVNVVTLLVTPDESEKLALAQSQGTVHFVLRNGGDAATPETAPVDVAELSGMPKRQPPAPRARRTEAAKAAPAAAVYSVETLVNGKVLVSKFPETQ